MRHATVVDSDEATVFDALTHAHDSPYCVKLELFCRVAGIPYYKPLWTRPEVVPPRSKEIIDQLERDGVTIDSDAVEREARRISVACDELYFAMLYSTWNVNWRGTRARYFDKGLRGCLRSRRARRRVLKALRDHGIVNAQPDDVVRDAKRLVDDLATALGDHQTFFDTPKLTTADVSAYAMLDCFAYGDLDHNPVGDYVKTKPTLMAFLARVANQYFPTAHRAPRQHLHLKPVKAVRIRTWEEYYS
ncbi:hypothetical protein CTAYLR_005808 [Chrysophaeum taylorii]|uniref:Metaxin glutathione S-transferase domain-containing protein n=1 Tax=Chrysophaeum taylorii TaxID=2483200 RepID=A0AAD7UN83_9STRA|nr:hypothetical protein CTAYLR_005808 [Chrysophaeum taylorii]